MYLEAIPICPSSLVTLLLELAGDSGREEGEGGSLGVLNAQRPVGYETPLAAGSSAGASNRLERFSAFGKVY